MILTKRLGKGKKIQYNIISEDSLLTFINEEINPAIKWKGFGSEIKKLVALLITSDNTISIKKWRKEYWAPNVGKYHNRFSKVFWLVRGYSEEEAIENISEDQGKLGKKFSEKIKENPEAYDSYTSTQIGWWIKKGYSLEDAIKLQKERQHTFSKEKLLNKFSHIEAEKIMNERNNKWQKSLDISKNITWDDLDKDARSIKVFIGKYGNDGFIELCKAYIKFSFISAKTKSIYTLLVENNIRTTDELYLCVLKSSYKTAFNISRLAPVQEYLKLSKYEILDKWYIANELEFTISRWGHISYYKNHYFQSKGELMIGTYLIEEGVDFTMHKKYPLSTKRCFYDFYIPHLDLYVEYCGMKTKEGIENYSKKKEKLKDFNVIWENDPEIIIDILSEYF